MIRIQMRSNGEGIVKDLDDVAGRIEDPTPVLEDFGVHMVEESIPATFAAGGRP